MEEEISSRIACESDLSPVWSLDHSPDVSQELSGGPSLDESQEVSSDHSPQSKQRNIESAHDCELEADDEQALLEELSFEVSYSSDRKARLYSSLKCMSQEILKFMDLWEKDGLPPPPPGALCQACSLTDQKGVELSDLEIATIENLSKNRFPLRYTFSAECVRRALIEFVAAAEAEDDSLFQRSETNRRHSWTSRQRAWQTRQAAEKRRSSHEVGKPSKRCDRQRSSLRSSPPSTAQGA